MYKVSGMYLYNNMMTYYQNKNTQKNLILEPLCCILKLILLQFKEKNTKISVSDNSITFNEPSYGQGLIRSLYGDCREDLHNIYHPLLKAVEWYPIDKFNVYYEECKKGLQLLLQVYDDNTTIHHTISHYISIIEGKNDKEVSETNPIIDNLKDFWKTEEINVINELLNLILKNIEKDVYLKCLENIIEEKEKKVNEYIQKVSTSY
jgi:hypothetical protein